MTEELAYTLKIGSLNPIWNDADIIMLHACFQALKDCVEKEDIFNCHKDWNQDEAHRTARIEIEFLYSWWLSYIANYDPFKDRGIDFALYEQDNEMLIRLIRVRRYLWS